MVVCNGAGDTDGGHCCWIDGKVCGLLDIDRGGTPRCKVWDKMHTARWRNAKVGRWFAENHPGFTCQDWPQNIPEVMDEGVGLCCWSDG